MIIRDCQNILICKAREDSTSDFEEGASGLLKDIDWTAILIDKPNILFVSESSMDVNNAKVYNV